MALIPLLRVNLLDRSSSPNFPISVTMPDSATLVQTDVETQKVESMIAGVSGISAYQATVGGQTDPFAPPGTVPANPTQAQVLILVVQGQYAEALGGVEHALKGYTGPAKVEVGQAQSSSNSSSSQMQVDVRAADAGTLQSANDSVLATLAHVSGLANLKSNLVASKLQYELVPTDKLAASGLGIQQLAAVLAQAVNGQVATQANLPQGSMSVRVQLPPGTADTAASLSALRLPTALGVVPLSTLATIQQASGPQSVNRINGDRDATITGTITANNTQKVQSDVTTALGATTLPAGASTSTGGVFAQLSNVLTQFVLALLAAIGLVYLIMVAAFRSLLKPLVLLVSIPFAATGAIVALVVTNTSLSLPGLIGLLMLTGIVVTNAIVLLALVEQYRDRGLELQEALIEGGRHRLRPILIACRHPEQRWRRRRLHQRSPGDRRDRGALHQHAAHPGPGPGSLFGRLPLHGTAVHPRPGCPARLGRRPSLQASRPERRQRRGVRRERAAGAGGRSNRGAKSARRPGCQRPCGGARRQLRQRSDSHRQRRGGVRRAGAPEGDRGRASSYTRERLPAGGRGNNRSRLTRTAPGICGHFKSLPHSVGESGRRPGGGKTAAIHINFR